MRGCAAHGFFPLSQGLRTSAVSLASLREFSPFREDCGELQHCLHSIASVSRCRKDCGLGRGPDIFLSGDGGKISPWEESSLYGAFLYCAVPVSSGISMRR